MGDGLPIDLWERRLEVLEEHLRCENDHDLDALMKTFAQSARYDDEPYNGRHVGTEAVRQYYEGLMTAAPDLHIEVKARHFSEEAIIQENIISGTHLGPWKGLPATGRRVAFPLCSIFTFDGELIKGERIYYDRATVFNQLGVFHDPDKSLGRVLTVLTHPVTLGRAVGRMARRKRASS